MRRVPLLVSLAALFAVAGLSAWAWIEVPGGTVPAGIGDDLQQVSKFKGLVVGAAALHCPARGRVLADPAHRAAAGQSARL